MFWLFAAALTLTVALAILAPFWRARPGAAEPAAAYDLRVYRDQLAEIDRDLLSQCAQEVGAAPDIVEEILKAETARFAAERLSALGLAVDFHRALAIKAIRSLKSCYPGAYRLTVLVCDFDGNFIVRVEEEEAL